MENTGEIVAVERHAGRASALRRTCERVRAANVAIVAGDAARFEAAEPFDRVLVDPPCSGLGTLQGHPDLRWRSSPETIERLAETQRAILRAGVAALRPGGTLVYSTCTVSPMENERLIAAFLAERPDFRADRIPGEVASGGPVWDHQGVDTFVQTLPHRDGTEGFFIARLRRAEGA
jgi:16S rRNA (cytosine967-C5)-methyltransferase